MDFYSYVEWSKAFLDFTNQTRILISILDQLKTLCHLRFSVARIKYVVVRAKLFEQGK